MGNQDYAPDKPKDCRNCYFWNPRTDACVQETCYYLLPEKGADGDCNGCPYGRYSPCIGYCLAKILWELRRKKGQSVRKEGERDAGRGK